MGGQKTTLTFKYLLVAQDPVLDVPRVTQESNDVESVLDTARVMLKAGHDITITVRREDDAVQG